MIKIKNKHEIGLITEAGRRLASVFALLHDTVQEGVSTAEIDAVVAKLLQEVGLKGECKGYGGYPAVSCISVNAVVVHGIPSKSVVLKPGDFVKVDVVGSYNGYCADMARGFFVPPAIDLVVALDKAAQLAFYAGFALLKPGVRLFTISHAIEQSIKASGFSVVKEFAGHGIGKKIHEEPEVPNFGLPNTGPVLREGMVLAIEPMITQSPCDVVVTKDGWTAVTSNGCLASHFENTVVVTSSGAMILTE